MERAVRPEWEERGYRVRDDRGPDFVREINFHTIIEPLTTVNTSSLASHGWRISVKRKLRSSKIKVRFYNPEDSTQQVVFSMTTKLTYDGRPGSVREILNQHVFGTNTLSRQVLFKSDSRLGEVLKETASLKDSVRALKEINHYQHERLERFYNTHDFSNELDRYRTGEMFVVNEENESRVIGALAEIASNKKFGRKKIPSKPSAKVLELFKQIA